jgi:hydroxymethylpyrimidine/phosphomethylpyrimidine kinase
MKTSGVMVIAGSDSCGGAGVQADLKTLSAFNVYAGTAITAITAQNTAGVSDILSVPIGVLQSQINAIDAEINVRVVKTGMLHTNEIINVVNEYITQQKNTLLVVDPVMIATSGAVLLDDNNLNAMRELISHSFVVTPNIPEAEALCGTNIASEEDIKKAAKIILGFGAKNVIIKGGHFNLEGGVIFNRVYCSDGAYFEISNKRIAGEFHGSGCTFASAVAACLFNGMNICDAATQATQFVHIKIEKSLHGIGKSRLLP